MQRRQEKELAEQHRRELKQRKQRFIQTTDLLRREKSPLKSTTSLSPSSNTGYEPEIEAELQRARDIDAKLADRKRERLERRKKRLLEEQRIAEKLKQEEEEEQRKKQEEQVC